MSVRITSCAVRRSGKQDLVHRDNGQPNEIIAS